jgi:hypothetical protein
MCRVSPLALVLALLVGCTGDKKKDDLPSTHPVKGSVLDTKGNPLKGGSVQFESGKPGDATVVGNISPDGTFVIKTFRDKSEREGAPEGEYQVTIQFPLGEGNAGAPPPPVTLTTRFKVEPKENTLNIDLRKK